MIKEITMGKEIDIKKFILSWVVVALLLGLSSLFIKIGDVLSPEHLIEECKNAAMSHDFVTANKKLNALKDKVYKYQYDETFDYVFNAEAMYICANGSDADLDRIVYILSAIPVEGTPFIEGDIFSHTSLDYDDYTNYTKRFNQKCNTLIDLSIINKKYSLAERIVLLYKSVPTLVNANNLKEDNIIKYSDEDKKRAIDKINKAIDDGVFPNVTKHIQ